MPQLFKGIALFTPGGDLIYCIDPNKQGRWHLHLCVGLQEILALPEPPHFLVPGYTATIDRWIDPQTGELKTLGEVYPPVARYQPLLNAVFDTDDLVWEVASVDESSYNPVVLLSYRHQFPQLWQDHDLIVRYEFNSAPGGLDVGQYKVKADRGGIWSANSNAAPPSGYVLRLFVSGNNTATENILKSIHQVLEQGLGQAYTLKVIDIFKHPEQAEINQISATPTLLRVWPHPVRRIVGELDNHERVLQILLTG